MEELLFGNTNKFLKKIILKRDSRLQKAIRIIKPIKKSAPSLFTLGCAVTCIQVNWIFFFQNNNIFYSLMKIKLLVVQLKELFI